MNFKEHDKNIQELIRFKDQYGINLDIGQINLMNKQNVNNIRYLYGQFISSSKCLTVKMIYDNTCDIDKYLMDVYIKENIYRGFWITLHYKECYLGQYPNCTSEKCPCNTNRRLYIEKNIDKLLYDSYTWSICRDIFSDNNFGQIGLISIQKPFYFFILNNIFMENEQKRVYLKHIHTYVDMKRDVRHKKTDFLILRRFDHGIIMDSHGIQCPFHVPFLIISKSHQPDFNIISICDNGHNSNLTWYDIPDRDIIVIDNKYSDFEEILEFFGMWRFESSDERYECLYKYDIFSVGETKVRHIEWKGSDIPDGLTIYIPGIHTYEYE